MPAPAMRYHSRDKSPLHASALRINDLQPGREILHFHKAYGSTRYRVLTRPFMGYTSTPDGKSPLYKGQEKVLVVVVRSADGRKTTRGLGDLGVTPYRSVYAGWSWNIFCFCVDVRKAHLLPPADLSSRVALDSLMGGDEEWDPPRLYDCIADAMTFVYGHDEPTVQ